MLAQSPLSDRLLDIGVNVAAAFLFLLVLAAIAELFGWLVQRNMRRFFRAPGGRSRLVEVKLSNIYVKKRGTLSVTGVSDGFNGPASAQAEYRYAYELKSTLRTGAFVGRVWSFLHAQVGRGGEDEDGCTIKLSPSYVLGDPDRYVAVDGDLDPQLAESLKRTLRRRSTLVLVGAPVYNALTYYVLRECPPAQRHFEFVRLQRGDEWVRGIRYPGSKEPKVRSLDQDGDEYRDYFVVQKIVDWPVPGKTIFVCAGTCTAATVRAVQKISDEWLTLARQFGSGPFAALYEFRSSERELPLVDHRSIDGWDQAPAMLWWSPRGDSVRAPGPEDDHAVGQYARNRRR